MTFDDFIDNFDEVNILHVNLNAFLSINSTIPSIITPTRTTKSKEVGKVL